MPFSLKLTTFVYPLPHLSGHYIEIPASTMALLNGNFKLRLVCTINTLSFQCGLVALGEGAAYILLNKKRMDQAKIKAGDQVSIILEEDTTEYGVPMPETLGAVLEADQEGLVVFGGGGKHGCREGSEQRRG
jgi:hypothetical protein